MVITGGSRGIGKAIAVLFAKNGAKVFICARNIEELKKVSDLIQRSGGVCNYVAADVTDEKQVEVIVKKVLEMYQRIDILINNAGVGVYKLLIDSKTNDWDYVMNTNLRAPFLCSKAFAPIMIKQKNGYIINIASGAGRVGLKNLSIYCASKFGLIGLTKSMRKELRDYGIDVFYICPGYVKTHFFDNFPKDFQSPAKTEEPDKIAEVLFKTLLHDKKRKLKEYFSEIVYRLFKY